jgi:hypothetical protein
MSNHNNENTLNIFFGVIGSSVGKEGGSDGKEHSSDNDGAYAGLTAGQANHYVF